LLLSLLEHNPQNGRDTHIPNDVEFEDEDVDILRIRMVHVHFPKLEAAGFMQWNRETNTIRKGPLFDEIRPLLVLMRDHADELPDDWI
jgi:hypothetical protein